MQITERLQVMFDIAIVDDLTETEKIKLLIQHIQTLQAQV